MPTVAAVGDYTVDENNDEPTNDCCHPLLLTDDNFTVQLTDKMCRIYVSILQQCLDTLERF